MKIFGYLITKDKSNEAISAQALDIGRRVETIIEERSNCAMHIKRDLEARVLNWYHKTKDEEFATEMGIRSFKQGKI